MNRTVARHISDLMLEFGRRLDESVEIMQESCEKDELDGYRRAIGQIMGTMLLEIMNPLYAQHPELKPHELE